MKNKNTKYIIIIVLVAVLTTVFLAFLNNSQNGPGQYDTLATCLKDKGVSFYGAFWCPHCRDQKKIFGNSAKLLPYVECSNPNATGQLQVCIDKKVESYPTWEFPDGTRMSKVLTPESLAQMTSCPLNNATTTTSAN